MSNKWKIEPVDPQTVQLLQDSLHISELLAAILIRRGMADPKIAEYFLFADRKDMQMPEQIPGMAAAAECIEDAVENGQSIAVYGDYDVDGVCGTVILMECLQALGAQAEYYIPDRIREGYGLNCAAIEKLARLGIKLLVTVDCGINSIQEIIRANEMGMKVIVTDHHTPESLLPEAEVIVNPHLGAPDESRELCGAGVILKLVQKLGQGKMSERQFDEWLELAALATVADIVPLRGENRILVKAGLGSMSSTGRPGLKALLRESKISGTDLQAYHLGFILAPRINAAGRLKSARLAVDLLMTRDDRYAVQAARELCLLNEERRRIEQIVVEEAAASVDNMNATLKQGILMVDGERWHPGVIGIAASRLADKYRLPVVLVSWEGDLGRGSARSVPGFNLYEALYACRGNLQQFGGHAMAAGLSIDRAQMKEFGQRLQEQAVTAQPSADNTVYLDGELFSHQLSTDMVRELRKLEPFGEGNPVPLFLIHHERIERASLMGANRSHFRAVVQPGNIPMISFRRAEWMNHPFRECRFDLLANVEINSYQGKTNVQIKAADLKPVHKKLVSVRDLQMDNILQATIDVLQSHQPAVFVFPTYRVLRYYQQFLSTMLQPDVLCPLHGHLSSDQQSTAKAAFNDKQPIIFLLTEPYWQYLCKLNNNQLVDSGWVVSFWLSEQTSGRADKKNCYPAPDSYPQIKLRQSAQSATSSALVYINNEETKKKRLSQWITEVDQVSVSDWSFCFSEYSETAAETNKPDQLDWKPILHGHSEADQIVLTDPPYSEYEALILAHQLNGGQLPVLLRSEYDLQQLIHLGYILREMYPERMIIVGMAAWLSRHVKNGFISKELSTLAAEISRSADGLISEPQVMNSLRIMSDLGLCRYRKKGSIIEIKVLATTSATLDLADSPYYREGQAEKRAFAKWQAWVKEQLAW